MEARVASWYQMEEDWKGFFGICIIEQLSFECMRFLAVCEDKKTNSAAQDGASAYSTFYKLKIHVGLFPARNKVQTFNKDCESGL